MRHRLGHRLGHRHLHAPRLGVARRLGVAPRLGVGLLGLVVGLLGLLGLRDRERDLLLATCWRASLLLLEQVAGLEAAARDEDADQGEVGECE